MAAGPQEAGDDFGPLGLQACVRPGLCGVPEGSHGGWACTSTPTPACAAGQPPPPPPSSPTRLSMAAEIVLVDHHPASTACLLYLCCTLCEEGRVGRSQNPNLIRYCQPVHPVRRLVSPNLKLISRCKLLRPDTQNAACVGATPVTLLRPSPTALSLVSSHEEHGCPYKYIYV